MPTYHYRCRSCQHEFDARQRFSDEPLNECPKCGDEVRRVISQVGLVFKGSGFYITDSRNGKQSAVVNGNSSASSKSDTESPTKAVSESEKPVKAKEKGAGSDATATAA